MRILIAAALLAALAARPAAAVDFSRAAAGTAGSDFLLLDEGARGIAMGGAMSAITDDATSIYWNPAGLYRVPRLSASFMHAQYVADITYDDISYAQRINDASVLGLGVRYMDGGSITQTNIDAMDVGTFHPRSYVVEAGWGEQIYDLSDSDMDIGMGVSGKMIRTDLGPASANGYALDFGVQSRFYTALLPYNMSFVIQNLGSGQKFDQVRDTLPLRLRFGGGVQPVRGLTLSVEGLAPINDAPYAAGGAEYSAEIEPGVKAAARVGVNSQTFQSLGFASMLNFGLGLTLGDFSFDYAFAPMGVLGTAAHRISLSYNLPAKISRRYRER
ncbi:MAG: PorV/PorQ family protein [Elusimicrobia bacterium]|nr:PorV/PorQ family protein [Elusimicrobiota bacterium]